MIPAAAAAAHTGGHTASSTYMGDNVSTQIVLLLLASGVVIFVQHARQGEPQQGDQYIAIGIVGFIMLFMAEFIPEFAFAFTLLFFVAVLLNSPNGIPVIAPTKKVSTP